MMSAPDWDSLRAQTLGTGHDEAVTINTRALIDKVLARYSGEWTTLRELLQNAADAGSKKVKVTLATSGLASDELRDVLLHHNLRALTVQNDGAAFQSSDWARLKKIAEGNPDESKIGAFGVGFYSVFADCEEPFVSSGSEAMAFYWKGDALFTKRMTLSQSTNTTFHLPYRTPDTAVPDLLSLAKFLVNSLIFVGLEHIELWLDHHKLLHLQSRISPAAPLSIDRDINPKSTEGLMKVVRVDRSVHHITAEWTNAVFWTRSVKPAPTSLRTFFSRLTPGVAAADKALAAYQERLGADLMAQSTASLFVHVDKASISTHVSDRFRAELERATKKPPPKTTYIQLLSSSLAEQQASALTDTEGAVTLFEAFQGKGRIFIGFTTTQTSGLDIHVSMPSVIPTVERESIDLVNRVVRTWNIELLRTVGIVARISWNNTSLDSVLVAGTLHRQYAFSDTTPLPEVGRLLEESFWTCNQTKALSMLSTKGVLPASKIRIKEEDLTFADGIPSVPTALLNTPIVQKLVLYGIVTKVTMADIKQELAGRALDAAQLRQFLHWLTAKISQQELDIATAKTIMSPVVANYQDQILVLETISSFLNPARIPAEMPLPPFVLPFELSKTLDRDLLAHLFDELQLVPWLRWLLDTDLTDSILPVISKNWDALSQSSKTTVVGLLANRACIPTKLGMRIPSQAYLSNVKLFPDLPNISGLQGVKEKVLVALGVRKTIEIGLVLDRLMSKSEWNHVDLIKYLASISADIPTTDLQRLREVLWPVESEISERPIQTLFVPEAVLRDLGLPILQWPGELRLESPEGRFLRQLGLKTHPAFEDLLGNEAGLRYFLENHAKHYTQVDLAKASRPFVPMQDCAELAMPHEVFVNERCAVLGFRLLRKDLSIFASRLGVRPDPPIQVCVDRILQQPRRDVRQVFAYMATRIGDLTHSQAEQLSRARIVPLAATMSTPSACFLGRRENKYAEIFDYVDFGVEANLFLLRVGSKHEPSIGELAGQLANSSSKIYAALGNPRYLELLRAIGDNWKVLKRDKELIRSLRKGRCLVGYRESEEDVKSWQLAGAAEIVIVDDTLIFDNFKQKLLVAPMEEELEQFYRQLGSVELGALLRKRLNVGQKLSDQSAAEQLHALIVERSRLFLHDYEATAIRHAHDWIQARLQVVMVQSLGLVMSLEQYEVSRKLSRKAAMLDDQPVLYVTGDFDMLEVSQALLPCLLQKVRPQSVFMLEMILESSLAKLRSRGYNVQRILHQRKLDQSKAAALELDRSQAAVVDSVPGSFPDDTHNSPGHATILDDVRYTDTRPDSERTLFDRSSGDEATNGPMGNNAADEFLGKKSTDEPMDRALGNGKLEEKVSKAGRRLLSSLSRRWTTKPEPVEASVEQNMRQAIEASRPHHSQSVTTQPSVSEVQESKTYCDAHQAQNIASVGSRRGVPVFLAKDLAVSGERFLEENGDLVDRFVQILRVCAGSYGIRADAVHVFYDFQGATIAFNTGGALFFNFRYFKNLHAEQDSRAEALVYWSVVIAHELAHNLVPDHSAAHSYWTETLIMKYFGRIARLSLE